MTSTPTVRITLPCKTVKCKSQYAKILNPYDFAAYQLETRLL
jgi:hypothetical protein